MCGARLVAVAAHRRAHQCWFHRDVERDEARGTFCHIAVAFCTSRWRDAMMALSSDAERAAVFDAQLRRVFDGADSLPPPAAHYVFDWTRDAPDIACAYSTLPYFEEGSPERKMFGEDGSGLYRALAAPEPDALRIWAGEHAAFPEAGLTAHAALYTGVRAAREALQLLDQTSAKL